MAYIYKSRHGGQLAVARDEDGHLQAIVSMDGGTMALVCIDPADAPEVIREMAGYGRVPLADSSLAAKWTALRDKLRAYAGTEQEIADDYGDMGTDSSWDRANKHWGKAEALREVLAAMDRMEAE